VTETAPSSPFRRNGLAVVEQGTFAAGHLALHVLLARWLDAWAYGTFVLYWIGYQAIIVILTGLVLEPLSYWGSGGWSERWFAYFEAIRRLQSRVAFVCLVAGLPVAYALRTHPALSSLAVVIACIPLASRVYVLRRASLTRLRPESALVGNLSYSLLLVVSMVTLHSLEALHLPLVWLSLAVSGLIGSLVTQFLLGSADPPTARQQALDYQKIVRAHWSYGRWLVVAGLLGFAVSGFMPIILEIASDRTSVATYRALLNFSLPGFQAAAAVGVLLVPELVPLSPGAKSRKLSRTSSVLLTAAAAYGILGILSGPKGVSMILGGTYSDNGLAVILAFWLPLAFVPMSISLAGLKSIGDGRSVLRASIAASVAAVLAGPAGIVFLGVEGAFVATALAYLAGGFVGWRSWRTAIRARRR
jgi:O-antigen/teichoic acid export membrane protein